MDHFIAIFYKAYVALVVSKFYKSYLYIKFLSYLKATA